MTNKFKEFWNKSKNNKIFIVAMIIVPYVLGIGYGIFSNSWTDGFNIFVGSGIITLISVELQVYF
jgi:hypothetical protein